MGTSDFEMMEAWVVRRDADAFTGLYGRYASLVYGVCWRVLRNGADAEEVAQECFLELARSGGRISISIPAWLHRVATRRALDRLRTVQRRKGREKAYAVSLPTSTTPSWKDLEGEIDNAIARLPDDERALILARYFDGKTEMALAEELSMTRSQVRYRLGKAIGRIRVTLLHGSGSLTVLEGLLDKHLWETPPVPRGLDAATAKMALAGVAPASFYGLVSSATISTPLKISVAALVVVVMGVGALWSGTRPGDGESVVHSPRLGPSTADALVASRMPAVATGHASNAPSDGGADTLPAASVPVAEATQTAASPSAIALTLYLLATDETLDAPQDPPLFLLQTIAKLKQMHGMPSLQLMKAVTLTCPSDHGGMYRDLVSETEIERVGPVVYPSDARTDERSAAIAAAPVYRRARTGADGNVPGDILGPKTFMFFLKSARFSTPVRTIQLEELIGGIEIPVLQVRGGDRSVTRFGIGLKVEAFQLEPGEIRVLGQGVSASSKAMTAAEKAYMDINRLFFVVRAEGV